MRIAFIVFAPNGIYIPLRCLSAFYTQQENGFTDRFFQVFIADKLVRGFGYRVQQLVFFAQVRFHLFQFRYVWAKPRIPRAHRLHRAAAPWWY